MSELGLSKALPVDFKQALNLLQQVRIADIRDIRAVDTDLLVTLRDGQHIIWRDGALTVLQKPELVLFFRDGTLKAEQLFKQIEMIHIEKPSVEDDSFWNAPQGVHHADALARPAEVIDVNKWILL